MGAVLSGVAAACAAVPYSGALTGTTFATTLPRVPSHTWHLSGLWCVCLLPAASSGGSPSASLVVVHKRAFAHHGPGTILEVLCCV